MKTLLGSFLSVVLLTGASATVVHGAESPEPAPGGPEGPVYIDSTEIVYLESFPVQAHLAVQGSLPTPCHEARWEVEQSSEIISVRLWSEADPDRICVQVLEPFEISIPLGSFESASLPVELNGEEVGRVEIGGEPGPGGFSLVAAGWSFGMCTDYCMADLVVDGERVILTGRSRAEAEPLYVNEGLLTEVAQERLASALEAVSGLSLEPVYGCPDCADGGAAYLELARDGEPSRHEMEFASPPEELAELHDLAMEVIAALEACASGELVTVDAPGCEPAPAG